MGSVRWKTYDDDVMLFCKSTKLVGAMRVVSVKDKEAITP
jgi:hypothetical protein